LRSLKDQLLGWSLTALLGLAAVGVFLAAMASLVVAVAAMPITTAVVAALLAWALWRRLRGP
jgi:hypothetical protein